MLGTCIKENTMISKDKVQCMSNEDIAYFFSELSILFLLQ